MRICDTHQHLWDLDKFSLPWTAAIPRLNRSFVSADYDRAAAGLGIEKAVYMEVDLAHHQRLAEVDYVAGLCESKRTVTAAAVVCGEPGAAGFDDYLSSVQTNPHVRGLRRCLHNDDKPPGHCLRPAFIADIRKLADYDLCYDIVIRPGELDDAAQLVASCAHVQFILDHCGNADIHAPPEQQERWRNGVAAVAAQPNVMCKVSGFIVTGKDRGWDVAGLTPVVEHVRACFGPERLMFGGDWPVCLQAASLADWVNALKAIVAGWPPAEQQALFYDNAARFYRLDG